MTQAGKVVLGSGVSAESTLTIRVEAVDVDGLKISRTRAEIEFRCSNQILPVQPWRPGINEYVAEIPPDLLLRLGQFDLVVSALSGWNRTSREMAPCDLLRVRMFAIASNTPSSTGLSPLESTFIGISIVLLVFMKAGLIGCWYRGEKNVAKRRAARKRRLLHELQRKCDIDSTLGPMDRVDAHGDLPIHYAAECGAPHALVRTILSKYPQGAKIKDARGNLPLHLLLHGLSRQTDFTESSSSMELLLALFPGAKLELDMDKKLPIQIVLDAGLPAALAGCCEIGVELGFPLDCIGGASNWHYLLADTPKKSTLQDSHSSSILSSDVLVEEIISRAQKTRRATIQQLAYATDAGGREAWAVATKDHHRKCLWKYLLFCGRYATTHH
jgi:hypothetical protein